MTDERRRGPPPDTPGAALRAWFAQTGDLLARTDAAGRIAWANVSFEVATGLTAAGSPGLLALAPDAAGPAHRAIRDALGGAGLVDAELDLTRPTGEALHLRASAVRCEGDWLWTLQPAPAPVEDAAAFFELAVTLGDVLVWRHDLATDRFHYNEHGRRMLGFPDSPDGVSLPDVRQRIHPDDLQRVVEATDKALHAHRPLDIEARYRMADGAWHTMLIRRTLRRRPDGSAQSLIGVALDITERARERQREGELKQYLRALRDAGERSVLINRHAGIGTWDIDFDGGSEHWDEQMFRLRGLEPQPRPPSRAERLALVHPDDRHAVFDAAPVAPRDAAILSYEFRVRLPDGTYRWLASRSATVQGERGEATRRVGVNWDITESRNAESARQEKTLAERQSRAKSAFLSRIGHELRTPLNAVLGFTQLLQADAASAGNPTQLTQLGHIRAAGEHLLALITDVLDFSSVDADKPQFEREPVDLAQLVSQALQQVECLAEGRGVRLHAGRVDGVASADPKRLLRVLVKLLRNAVQYNRPSGEVWIDAAPLGAAVRISVRDSGPGLDATLLQHLFEPLDPSRAPRRDATRAEAGSGASPRPTGDAGAADRSGIDLPVAHALVRGMGGTIDVTSEPGVGSVFEVTLPAHEAPLEPPADLPQGRAGRLLYIEDNAVNVLLVEQMVGTLPGLALESAPNGATGVERARELRPDLVLVDLQLPDFDGYEVLRRLRAQEETKETPCVALSANAMPDDIERGLAAGFADYWTKPINFRSFLSALEQRFPLHAIAPR